ncbi:hypothetical protein C1H46_007084 [Malus baccata]|uniref:GAG-pre-integrase domain-containing protein n=1 Tax=Malus baccata TaxID=106549 RepID=A0A540N881_MALBA|nr:hypothetical protein C1H46_007084 [Malus baccata]
MFYQGESSATRDSRQFYQGESSNFGANRQFYQGNSSNSQNHNGVGFVGQYQRNNGNHGGVNGNQDFNTNQAWIMDTGATHHMTGNLEDLNMIAPLDGDQKITIGSGECLPMKSDKATKIILMRGKSNGGLYHIPKQLFFKYNQLWQSTPKVFLGQLIKASLWHHRLGHPTNEVLHSMLSHSQITYKSYINKHVCSFCLKGKMSRQVFESRTLGFIKPFEIISNDVWGPSSVISIEDYKYYVSFIDECTKFTWIFL